ncbi:molybdopterin-synthase adenylyltransferase MoeB [Massilia sp. W12]|uniref:HesA/MoeB/ThiF family protein n=1 Tax=Massilia sp. W12 TaxID=3126507 RepID=UPI0030D428E9
MNDQQLLRYSRHILLNEIGFEGQQALSAAHALVIGAGGLGSPVALYLAAAGLGRLTLADHDTVDLSNLQRQLLHTSARVGLPKVESARICLQQINPEVEIIPLQEKLQGSALQQAVAGADLVLDCSDNFATRHAVNAACVAARKPLVSGAAVRLDGQISVFDSRQADAPCYACLFPPDQQFQDEACGAMGVFAPLVGIIGAMQAAEALKLLTPFGRSLAGRLLLLDVRSMEWSTIRVSKNPDCPVCGAGAA